MTTRRSESMSNEVGIFTVDTCLLRAYYVPGPVLDPGDTAVNKTKTLDPHGLPNNKAVTIPYLR